MRRAAICVGIAGFMAHPLHAQQRPPTLDDFLVRAIGLTPAQIGTLARGTVVWRVLPTTDNRNVAVFGAVRVGVSRAALVSRLIDPARPPAAPGRLSAGLFGRPATEADLRTLSISGEDLRRLRECRPNSCDFKLPATTMDWLRTNTDWNAPDVAAVVSRHARRRLVDFVNDYARRGNVAMVVYDDRGSVHASDALTAMLRDSSYAFRVVPSFGRHLLEYPHDSLAGSTDRIFWAIDEMPRVRPTLRVMHEFVYSPPELPGTTLLASKQIYANHYFEAGLELLSIVDDDAPGTPGASGGVTVIAVRRYRFDHLPTGGPVSLRELVIRGLREQLVADLSRLKRDNERP